LLKISGNGFAEFSETKEFEALIARVPVQSVSTAASTGLRRVTGLRKRLSPL
jgi:hypothetical protein